MTKSNTIAIQQYDTSLTKEPGFFRWGFSFLCSNMTVLKTFKINLQQITEYLRCFLPALSVSLFQEIWWNFQIFNRKCPFVVKRDLFLWNSVKIYPWISDFFLTVYNITVVLIKMLIRLMSHSPSCFAEI